MSTQLLIQFIIFNILNVIIQTIKSVATIKCNKGWAAIINAIAYGFYTYIIVLTMCDLPLFWKAGIVALCNLIGVYIVKWGEEKARKDKLWKIECTVLRGYTKTLHSELDKADIPHNYLENVGKYTLFNIFCATQKESARAKEIIAKYEAKYFVSESKTL